MIPYNGIRAKALSTAALVSILFVCQVPAVTKAPLMLQDFEGFTGDNDFYGYFAVKYTATFQLDAVNHSPAGRHGWKIIASAAGDGGGGYHISGSEPWNADGYDSIKLWVKPTGRDGIITVGIREHTIEKPGAPYGEYWVNWVYMDHRFPQARWFGLPFNRMVVRSTEQGDSIINGQIEELACVVGGTPNGTGYDTVTVDDFQFVAKKAATGMQPRAVADPLIGSPGGFVRTWINFRAPRGSRLTVAQASRSGFTIVDCIGRRIVHAEPLDAPALRLEAGAR